jgi:hypothetical protein
VSQGYRYDVATDLVWFTPGDTTATDLPGSPGLYDWEWALSWRRRWVSGWPDDTLDPSTDALEARP